MESGAILLYLAEKQISFCQMISQNAHKFYNGYFSSWWRGPLFVQFGHFYAFADGINVTIHTQLTARYIEETKRLLGVLDKQLGKNAYLGGR